VNPQPAKSARSPERYHTILHSFPTLAPVIVLVKAIFFLEKQMLNQPSRNSCVELTLHQKAMLALPWSYRMVKVILVRHGETDWNLKAIFRGRLDIELNETGIQQAHLLGKYLSQHKITAVYSSPLKRALATAKAIATYHHLSVRPTPNLIDFNYGEWQGLSPQAVSERYKDLYQTWQTSPHLVTIPFGENLASVRQRALTKLQDIISKHRGTIILVSHRVVNKVLICAILGLDDSHFWNVRLDNCGITTFQHNEGHYVLIEHNNTSYLKTAHKINTDF
jgi:broad specificity phosphatase PhoE